MGLRSGITAVGFIVCIHAFFVGLNGLLSWTELNSLQTTRWRAVANGPSPLGGKPVLPRPMSCSEVVHYRETVALQKTKFL